MPSSHNPTITLNYSPIYRKKNSFYKDHKIGNNGAKVKNHWEAHGQSRFSSKVNIFEYVQSSVLDMKKGGCSEKWCILSHIEPISFFVRAGRDRIEVFKPEG